jgi:hypothetical protein
MWARTARPKAHKIVFTLVLLCMFVTSIIAPYDAGAVAQLVQTKTGVTDGGTSVSASFTSAATANSLLVAVCGGRSSGTFTGPSGFTTAKLEAGTPTQGIFYKVAAGGEQSISCTSNASMRLGIHIYEYRGVQISSPLNAVNTTASTGASSSPASGSVVTTNANDLLLAAITTNANTSISAWNNSFTLQSNFVNGGTTASRAMYSGAARSVSATGTYSSTATASASGAWRGQIAAFKLLTPILSTDVVDGSGNSVVSPGVTMSSATYQFSCQTVTGTLGTSSQKIRISNNTATPTWTLSVAATGGSASKWSVASLQYAFNNPSSSGCGSGQLTINPATGELAPQSGCPSTGLALGSSAAFNSGVLDSISLATANSSAAINCYWDLTGVSLSQKIPAEQMVGAYSINLTLTVTAS